MARAAWDIVLKQVRSLAARKQAQGEDAELLGRFVAECDEAAFEVLLGRHGPMVLRVARRVLRCPADAEDVLQATFLLLARKAGSIRKRTSLASWLHGVAHRLALHARSERARRKDKESRAAAPQPAQSAWNDLDGMLDEVLGQLPEKYRTPLVYCYLEGRTQEEVANLLGVPLGTVRCWLTRGRELLRQRLVRRGVSLSVAGLNVALLANAADAAGFGLPPPLLHSTLQAVPRFVMGKPLDTISPAVSALIREGMSAMILTKLKSKLAALLIVVLLATGTGLLVPRSRESIFPEPAAAAFAPAEAERVDQHGDPLPPGARVRLGTVRFRHEGWVGPIAFAPDGRAVAGVAGNSLVVWNAAIGQVVRRVTLGTQLHCLAFAPDGKSVVVGGEDCVLRLLDLDSGKEVRRFVGHKAGERHFDRGILEANFSADGQTLVSRGSDQTVRLWEVATGKERSLPRKELIVLGVSPDGKILAGRLKGSEKVLRLWDLTTEKEMRQLSHRAEVQSLHFSPDGKFLAVEVKALAKDLWLWDLTTEKEAQQLAHPDEVGRLTFSADGKRLAVAFSPLQQVEKPGMIALWDVSAAKQLGTLTGHEAMIFALQFAPDGTTLASGSYDKTVRLWDLSSGKELHSPLRLTTPIYQLAFSRDGKMLLGRGAENQVRVWGVATWRDRYPADGPSQDVGSLAFSPDGKRVATTVRNGIWLWDSTNGKVLQRIEREWTGVPALAFSADSKQLITATKDGGLQVWDTKTGEEQRRTPGRDGHSVEQMAFSPDGQMLAVWGDKPDHLIVLRDSATGKDLRSLEIRSEGGRPTLYSLCFSRDGRTLYACSGTHLNVLRWDVATGKELSPIGKHDGGVNGIALAPDDRSLAAVSMGGSLFLWELASGQKRWVVKDAGYATSVAFSPDGRLLALADRGRHRLMQGKEIIYEGLESRDEVRLVRVADGKVVHRFTGHTGGICCLGFSPDGRTLASGSMDTTAILWEVPERIAAKPD